MKDVNGIEIQPGDRLRRVVDGAGTGVGYEYEAILYDFDADSSGEDLVADGGFIKELLTPDRAKEFEVL